ncbi:Na/Pi-cotransporter II-related protein [Weeksella virosa]|uniref:Na/Pi cotransporter family protein n=1 Tax=Weeksella virosa TaxID=1014 RepID=UPI000E05A2C3|nr:Na/Pi symporter [Weeksella virosa]SUP54607.1 Na/Pi-cotransporter II-related protein [Weeksella virosa]
MQILFIILQVLGAVALFIYAMKMVSDNLQAISGDGFQLTLNKLTRNNFTTFVTGTIFTTSIQSSSAASIFFLSFVNAGLINLKKAFSLIIGANIGTTLTLWLIFADLQFNLLYLALPLLIIAVPFYTSYNRNRRLIGGVMIGFTMIFFALYFLKTFLPDITDIQILQTYLYTDYSWIYARYLLFIIFGLILTLVIHFSSASIAISVLLVDKGLPLELAAMMILGANIGTTFTAQLASFIGNKSTRIVANFHTYFNVASALLFFFIVPYIIPFLQQYISNSSIVLISFDTITNAITAIIALIFLNPISEYFNKKHGKILGAKSKSIERMNFITVPYGNNANLYLNDATKNIMRLAAISRRTIQTLGRMITESDDQKFKILKERVLMLENESDEIEEEITTFLMKIYNLDINESKARRINQLMVICHHLESISDIAIKMTMIHNKRRKSNSFITPNLRIHMTKMQQELNLATSFLFQNLSSPNNEIDIEKSREIEHNINRLYKAAEADLIKSIEKDKLGTLSALYYKELIQNYEYIGDHIYKANMALTKD